MPGLAVRRRGLPVKLHRLAVHHQHVLQARRAPYPGDHDGVIDIPGQGDLLLRATLSWKEAVPGAGGHIVGPSGLVGPQDHAAARRAVGSPDGEPLRLDPDRITDRDCVLGESAKECGCEYADYVINLDRPLMCYTERNTNVTKRCEKHLEEYKEDCEQKEKEQEQARQTREEQRKVLKSHLVSLMDIEHEQYVLIKQAIAKYKTIHSINMTDLWIRHHINLVLVMFSWSKKSKTDGYVVKSDKNIATLNIIIDYGMGSFPGTLNGQKQTNSCKLFNEMHMKLRLLLK